jgi:hypothetical protein
VKYLDFPMHAYGLSLILDGEQFPHVLSRILGALTIKDGTRLRNVNRLARNAVTAHKWDDMLTLIPGKLEIWRSMFPNAISANIRRCRHLNSDDFMYLRGIHTLDMRRCDQSTITDAAFAHLQGIHTLHMAGCSQSTITVAAFAHLEGIHTLNMRGIAEDFVFACLRFLKLFQTDLSDYLLCS